MPVQTGIELNVKKTIAFYDTKEVDNSAKLEIVAINGRYGLADVNRGMICSCDYDEIVKMDDNHYKLRQGTRWGIMNSFGQMRCPCSYSEIISVEKGGMYCAMDDDVYFIKFKQ